MPARSTRSRRVLIVDDNVGAARMLKLLIGQLRPHELEVAHDGPSALETARQFKPDLLLLDIGLPGMDGYEVATRLRADDAFSGTMLVALTGRSGDEERQKSHQAGFDRHLVKPVVLDVLLEVLEQDRV